MIKIVVIGSGNVAFHLIKQIEKSDEIQFIQNYTRLSTHIKEADLYIVAVSDDAIAEVSASLAVKNKLVVHTSGTQPMSVLSDHIRKGVWYPLQTFSKQKKVDFKTIPFCIEATTEADYQLLERVTVCLTASFFRISSEQRKSLHVAAVFVCNFVNQMYQIGSQICEEHQVPFDILRPLIQETAKKIQYLPPKQAQTGPAFRNDSKTIQSHLDFLEEKQMQTIYTLITKSIQQTHG